MSFFLILLLVLDFHMPTRSKDTSQVTQKLLTKYSSSSGSGLMSIRNSCQILFTSRGIHTLVR
uniref:Uncharacterized protein n=1 Tax=Arundo donax TaxID=35708 RepID=A0A0A9GQN2_ARUDO